MYIYIYIYKYGEASVGDPVLKFSLVLHPFHLYSLWPFMHLVDAPMKPKPMQIQRTLFHSLTLIV